MALSKEQLLAEVEDLLRTMPPRGSALDANDENLAWYGRASAVIGAWNSTKALDFRLALGEIESGNRSRGGVGLNRVTSLMNEARFDLRMNTTGPVAAAVATGQVFDYFDEVRQIIEQATSDVLFVDPYLDAEFVSRYLPHVKAGIAVRLLARECLKALLPAVDTFAAQHKTPIQVRCAGGFHDRYVFIDRSCAYHSGASFKDGAKKAPTTLTQVTDTFAAVLKIYEDIWATAKVER